MRDRGEKETYIETDKHRSTYIDRHNTDIDVQTYRRAYIHAHRHTDKQKRRQTDRLGVNEIAGKRERERGGETERNETEVCVCVSVSERGGGGGGEGGKERRVGVTVVA